MTEVTERAAAESYATAAAAAPSQPQQSQQQQAAGDVDGETRHRQQMQSALAALPRKNSYEDFSYDDDGYNNSGYERYSAPYASSSPIVSAANAPTSTALTLYSEDDDEPGYAHLFDSPEEDGPKASSSPSAAYYTKYKTPVKNPFTGLSNQGATCYMNSLLQTMFMTPEFRKGLYQWQFGRSTATAARATNSSSDDDDDDSGDDNIPFQLQKLFAKLQVSSQDSISTKALTKSFGWTGADVFQQHDVQELCRVLFDAIERSFKGTVNETLVNDLYQGALKDYVQCHTCGYESSRIDNFLDLSLVIRPFGSEEMMKSVEEAIELFLRPELLNKENQWNCDRCATKRDAIKGLKFAKLPYLLSLQLKRFDFDYATMNRIKLHNRVSFPKYLDMNSYVSDTASGRGEIARKMSMERHELEATASGRRSSAAGDTDASHRVSRLSSMDETQALAFDNVTDLDDVGGSAQQQDAASANDSEPMDTWSAAFDPHEMIKRNGPHVYELYSVLIHSGSALGGHYYAYIKSFADGKWFNFNDSHVSAISDDELQTAFGGGGSSSSYSARMSYSTCAYMLMYRLVSTEKNVNVIPDASIPQYLQEKFAADEARARAAEAERMELAKKVLVRFFMKGSKPKNVEKAIHVYKTSTLGDALAAAVAAFANEPDIVIPASLANVRLRGYNDYNSMLSDTFDGKEDATLTSLGIYTGQQLFIEVKSDREAWEAYDPFKLQLFVRRFVDPEQRASSSSSDSSADLLARCIQVDDNATLGTLCQLVARKFGVPPELRVRLLTKNGYGTSPVRILTLSDDAASMNLRLRMNLHVTNGTEVYMETTSDLSAPSPAKAHFEREANTIVVNFKYLTRAPEPVRIDRRETVAALKRAISAKIGLAPSQFKLLRGVNSSGVEIKTVDSTLYSLSIGANNTLFVLEGVPLNRGEYNFRLMLHRPVAPAAAEAADAASSAPFVREPAQLTVVGSSAGSAADSAADDDVRVRVDDVLLSSSKDDAAFVFAGPMVISEDMMVDAIRTRAHALLVEKQLIAPDVPASHIRLRDLRQSTMTQILVDGRKLLDASDSAVYELRGIVAQVLPEPEQAQPEHRVVEFVFVDRSAWRFRPARRCEVVVSKDEQVARPTAYIADAASRALGIPAERLRFARIPYHRESCDILEVVSYEFHTAEDVLAARAPDYQELLLVIDADAPLTFMTHRERLAIQRFLAAKSEEKARAQRAKYASVSGGGGSGYVYHKPKEAALVIRTKSRSSERERDAPRGGGSTASSTGTSGAVAPEDGVTIRSPSSPAPAAAGGGGAKRATAARVASSSSNNNLAGSDTDDEDDDVDAQTDAFGVASGALEDDGSSVLADLDLLGDVRASFR